MKDLHLLFFPGRITIEDQSYSLDYSEIHTLLQGEIPESVKEQMKKHHIAYYEELHHRVRAIGQILAHFPDNELSKEELSTLLQYSLPSEILHLVAGATLPQKAASLCKYNRISPDIHQFIKHSGICPAAIDPLIKGLCKERANFLIRQHELESSIYPLIETGEVDLLTLRTLTKISKETQKIESDRLSLIEYEDAIQTKTTELSDPHSEYMKKYQSEILRKAIEQLPEDLRTIVTLYYFDELTYLDIAQKLGVSKSTVSVHMAKALDMLRDNLSAILGLSQSEI